MALKIFGTSPMSTRKGESLALEEFSFLVPKTKNIGQARLEVDCFKKKRQFSRWENMKVKRKESFGKSDSDSDYGSMPRDFDNDIWRKDSTPLLSGPTNRTTKLNSMSVEKFRIDLHPEEEWARNAKRIWWDIQFNRYWKILCRVTEFSVGGRSSHSTEARISYGKDGEMTIIGNFKRLHSPEFQLTLSSSLTNENRRKQYAYIGTLKQGHFDNLEVTHFATVSKSQL